MAQDVFTSSPTRPRLTPTITSASSCRGWLTTVNSWWAIYFLNLMVKTWWLHISALAGRCSCSHVTPCARLVDARLHQEGRVVAQLPRSKSARLSRLGSDATQIPAACAEASKCRGTARSAEDDLERLLAQNSIQKAIFAFRERLKACIEAEGGHFEHLR